MKNVMLNNLMFDCCDSLVFAMMFVLFDGLVFWLVCENLHFGASAFPFLVWI